MTDLRGLIRAAFPPPVIDGPPDNRTAAITLAVGAAVCVFLFWANPLMRPFEEYNFVNVAVLLWLPLLSVILLMRQSPAEFGLAAGDRKVGMTWLLIGYAIMLPAVIISAHSPAFSQYYIQRITRPLAISNWWPAPYVNHPTILTICYYEIGMGVYFFCWEFFFRGYLLFGLARGSKIGAWGAIILQTIPFTLLHWSPLAAASKPGMEIFGAALGGPALGYLALRTRSCFYGFLIHWLMAGTLDLLVVWPYLTAGR
jgi:membrane protease YdiL (CAAX protease family)